jgi:8-hydroxy-5-deazaflavin:NADPH oxidoreductase
VFARHRHSAVTVRVCKGGVVHVGIVGGTGPLGRGLTVRLASAGHYVTVGSRDGGRAEGVRRELTEAWPLRDLDIGAGENHAAAGAELVVMATPWEALITTARSLHDELQGKVVVCVANALARQGREFVALTPPRGSMAATLQAELPGALVAAACHHLPAHALEDLAQTLSADVLVCSDHEEATEATIALVGEIPGLRPLDAGSLSAAAPVEAFTSVLVNVNRRYKVEATLCLGGIDTAAEHGTP